MPRLTDSEFELEYPIPKGAVGEARKYFNRK